MSVNLKFEIPFIAKVKVSEKRNKKYFEFKANIKLPAKYSDKKRFIWKRNDKKKVLLFDKETNTYVVKNIKSFDKPRYFRINGQDIYSGNIHAQSRATLVTKLHEWFKEVLLEHDEQLLYFFGCLELGSKIRYELEFHKIYKEEQSMDVDNHWIYEKCFQDVLVDLKYLQDDNPQYIKARGSVIEEVATEEEQKIVITISKV
jgi:hypothetical protein